MVKEHGLDVAEPTFRAYINKSEKFREYFKKVRYKGTSGPCIARFETGAGVQAQIDRKEEQSFILSTGEIIYYNIFVFILSYSRYRIYQVSHSKTQDILFHFLDHCFEIINGIPSELLTDNMKTIMDIARTKTYRGKVNKRFQEFANDYGFKVKPCIAGRPSTKAKVESPMRILDELQGYQGKLNYYEFIQKVQELCDRENNRFHQSYLSHPIKELEKEKGVFRNLPKDSIRRRFQIKTLPVRVNSSAMITYQQNQYSVPPKYIGKILQIQVYDDRIHIFDDQRLICVHRISKQRLNYDFVHYQEILKKTMKLNDDEITRIARENLKILGEKFNEHNNI